MSGREQARDREMIFWTRWVEGKGLRWPDDFTMRLDPDSELQEVFHHLFENVEDPSKLKILDVGAGPMTFLGKNLKGAKLDITAVDALGSEFSNLLDKYDIDPPVKTLDCPGEQLTNIFDRNSFDAVVIRNALDHSNHPLWVVYEMINVVKPGGKVFLMHRKDEADKENGLGMHQWNIGVEDGDVYIRHIDRRTGFMFKDALAGLVDVTIEENDPWVNILLTKLVKDNKVR